MLSRAVVLFVVIAAADPVMSGFLSLELETVLGPITIDVITGTCSCSVFLVRAHCHCIVRNSKEALLACGGGRNIARRHSFWIRCANIWSQYKACATSVNEKLLK
jgi:hypothetical protein